MAKETKVGDTTQLEMQLKIIQNQHKTLGEAWQKWQMAALLRVQSISKRQNSLTMEQVKAQAQAQAQKIRDCRLARKKLIKGEID